MKLTLSSVSICRTPIFPITENLENVWNELKDYIHESSPSFFDIIKDYNYAAFLLSAPKTKYTVWKYFNRARFRATPYGKFAAFAIVPISKDNEPDYLRLLKKPLIHRFANWQEKENISFDAKWLTYNAVYLRTNTTIYECDEELRYINIDNAAFELSSVINEKTTKAIIDFCHTKRTLTELQSFLKTYGLTKAMTNYFVEQLISFQLLLTDFQPNIIGTDYFKRIAYPQQEQKNDYIIAERQLVTGQVSAKKLEVLIEVIHFLNRNLPVNRNPSLDNFKAGFTKRFEHNEVPLLVAMDPEIGVGYHSLAQDNQEDLLVQELKAYKKEGNTADRSLSYTVLHQFILNQFLQQKVVQLHEFIQPEPSNILPVANTISIMLQHADEHLIIEQIGGCTANSLLGRFTMASDQVTALGKKFASIEQEANPEILFFDIAYQIEKNADNINRRKSIYDYELPILSWTETDGILDADDILVSIRGEEIILRSAKLGKRVIPKLASAYNYSRSDLAIYRFLSDMQHQNIHSRLALDVLQALPGLTHYQRIQYKNVILSTERWLVPQTICIANNQDVALSSLQQWLLEIGLQRAFKSGTGDQTLLFNPALAEDLIAFTQFCKNKKELYIEEAFIPASPVAEDENGGHYLSEFIVNLEHQEQLYQPFKVNPNNSGYLSSPNVFTPGEEWLYFEIYCHPTRCNAILMDIYGSLIPDFKKKIRSWFFIRYTDPAYHIRLRLQLKDTADASAIISGLSKLLKRYILTGIISDLQLKTYRQETGRYGPGRMHLVEKCFSINSEFVMELTGKSATINQLYYFSITMMEAIWVKAGYTMEQQLFFAGNMSARFAAEMNITAEGFKKLNVGYKEFESTPFTLPLNKVQLRKMLRTEKSFHEVLETCSGAEKDKVLADLFHMHTNRLFNDDQRMHELIIYYYLTKRLKTKIGRLKKESSFLI